MTTRWLIYCTQTNVVSAIEKLSALEKQTRQASDLASTSSLLVAIITISKDSGDWQLLNDQILLLSKKHGQLKQATTKMVQVAMSFISGTPNDEKKLSLIETLRTVTEGKVSILHLGLQGVLMTSLDICGSRARSSYPHTLRHEESARGSQRSGRYIM